MSTLAPTAVPTLAAVPASVRPGRPAVPVGPRLVLTRRGRRSLRLMAFVGVTTLLAAGLVLLWLAVASVVAPGAVAGDGTAGVRTGAASVEADVPTVTVVVGRGDTLWQIARAHAPERDPRAVVADVVQLNELTSTGVHVGDQLLVPTA
ncbi:LysM peptidoglycan-binding domain-containing protein [Aquipuribacter sp. MA13-6]|uniref:LysM peptidoglycan-binding domain-containing protein n=1 Tax=unclassified Aquipuribacter TaxID=2635084 RepID=UPI003EEB26E0